MSALAPLHIIKQTNKLPSASVIFLHGSGDTGPGISDWIKFLIGNITSPHIRFVFPTAPLQPYTPLGEDMSHVWFNRIDVRPNVPEHKESIDRISYAMETLIDKELKKGVPLNRIVVGGFSMGGALALHTVYRFSPGLAGVFTLSSFLNHDSAIYNVPKLPELPLYMFHGDKDLVVPLEWGQETYEHLRKLGAHGEFIRLKNTLHELKKDELQDLMRWINKVLPPLNEVN